MNEDLQDLLKKWEVEEEYVENFKKAKIKKITTLNLLTPALLEGLIPDVGPRLDFNAHLAAFNSNGDQLKEVISEQGSAGTVLDTTLPINFMEDDDHHDLLREINRANPTRTSAEAESKSDKSAADSTWKSPVDVAYNLESVLKSCINGQLVLSVYHSHKTFNDKQRNILGDTIVSEYLRTDVNRKMPRDVEKAIGGHIVNLFPSEEMESWVSPSLRRQNAAGRRKILTRYYAMRRVLMAGHLITKRPSDAGLKDIDDDDIDDIFNGESAFTDEQRMEHEDNDLWLRNHKQPASKVQLLWKETSKWRIRKLVNSEVTIHDYMKQYPVLSETGNYFLLEMDYETLYPNTSLNLYVEWPMLSAFICSRVNKKVKDEIESALTEEGKKVRIIRALPHIFQVITAVKKGKKSWRLSRQEGAEGLILHVPLASDISTALDTYTDKCQEFGISLGPKAIMVGQDEDHITASYVRINKIQYEVEDPVKALDITFKTLHALDSEYNLEVLREFLFLESAIYKIPLKKGRKGADNRDVKIACREYEEFKKKQ